MIAFKIVATVVVLLPAAFGLVLLFASADRLFRGVRWLPLPMPKKNTRLYTALLTFWRALGAMALLLSVAFAYILFVRQG